MAIFNDYIIWYIGISYLCLVGNEGMIHNDYQ